MNVRRESEVDYTQRVIDLVDDILEKGGSNYSRAAAMIVRDGKPMSRQSFTRMVKMGTVKFSVILEIADKLGVEIDVV